LDYSNGYHLEINPTAPSQYKVIRNITTGINIKPKNWLELGAQMQKITDSASNVDKNAPETYASKFYISFLRLQECLDIQFMRIKNAGDPEQKAYYIVALNLNFLENNYQINQVGSMLNRRNQSE
jgi:hypothetical protein